MLQKVKRLFDSESKTLAKNSSWLMLSTVFQVGIVFLKSIVIARALGLSEYGAYATIMAFVGTVQEVFNLNFGPALIKFSADSESKGENTKVLALIKLGYLVAIATALLSVVGVFLVATLFYDTFFETTGYQQLIVLLASGTSLVFVNTIPRVVLRIYDKFKINSLVNIVCYIIEFAAISIGLLLFDGDINLLISILFCVAVFNSFLVNGTALAEIKNQIWGFWNVPISALKDEKKQIISFVFNNSLSKTLQKLLKKGDILLLAAFTTTEVVGLYDVARKLSFSLLAAKDPLIVAVYPQIAKLIANDQRKAIRSFLFNIGTVALIPYVLGLLILAFFGDWIIQLTYGPEFVAAKITLVILALAVGLEIVLFWSVPYILSLGKAAYRLKATLVSAILTTISGFILVQHFDILGVAISVFLGALILQTAFGFVIYNDLKR